MPLLQRASTWAPADQKSHRHILAIVSKRKFWNPKKWFRKKQKTGDEAVVHLHHPEQRDGDGNRSRSTGELSIDEESPPRSHHEGRNSTNMHPGLSVSHDSVFHPLNSGSSDLDLDEAQSSSSLSISQPLGDAKLQTELSSRLRLRRGRGDTSEDDEGLPRSPPCGSPAAATDSYLILEKTVNNKDLPTKSHSTCSDGSLLSMDSSEMDEDSVGLQSRHSSRVSLNEKKVEQESDLELGPSFSSTPLNHSAAHHRVSVRPKRTYGAPRRKKGQLASALPATPEVNEDASIRSISPDSITTEPITELYSSTARSLRKTTLVPLEVKLKCNSLPAGVTPPTSDSFRLSRSRSNAGKSQDDANLDGEIREEKLSLFERLFPRRSGKKKKKEEARDREEKLVQKEKIAKMEVDGNTRTSVNEERKSVHIRSATPTSVKTISEVRTSISSHSHTRREEKPSVAPRSGAASRQRIQPIDIPASPKDPRSTSQPMSPEKAFSSGTSPIQMELESFLKQRQLSSTTSPKESVPSPPQSPKLTSAQASTTSKHFQSSYSTEASYAEHKISSEDIRSKIKLAGLSSLQQRVLSLNAGPEEDNSYTSLMEVPLRPSKPLAKSHSFKNQKPSLKKPLEEVTEDVTERRKSVTKATSLDSVKNLEEPSLKSELKLTLQPAAGRATQSEVPEPEVAKKKNPEIVGQSYKKASIEKEPSVAAPELANGLEEESGEKLEAPGVRNASVPKSFSDNSITISGPSHTAIVNVTSKSEDFSKSSSTSESEVLDSDGSKKLIFKESQVSVTKIQLKHETTQITNSSVVLPKASVPEFFNKQLNRVETRPTSNIVFSMKSPKISPEELQPVRPKTLFNFPPPEVNGNKFPRKFSKEDVEIIEKPESNEGKDVSPPKTPTTPTQARFKKNDSKPSSRKSSVISITSSESTPVKESIRDRALKTRSISLDSLKSEEKLELSGPDKSSQDSLDKRSNDNVVLRRKSFVKQKNEDEPELMKVFARRSLKLKDSDIDQIQEAIADEQKQRDFDKENNTETTPEVEKKILVAKEDAKTPLIENIPTKPVTKDEVKVFKQPLAEIKKSPEFLKNVAKDEPEVQLRRSLNNNVFLATQRTASLTTSKTVVSDFHIKKQGSLNERRKTDQWNKKDEIIEEKQTESKLIVAKTEDTRTETKNFSQRRAEWEKRVQQAQK
ncbi:uncharacterized protein LOC109538146 isoform X2 [Dendroctonus ponderosae]|uniref:uncharacterized protein LOC109538146 isoform X2 n=1 Tax=Dendroctonus ponderosae TaxID=77166 RepID=UPI00203653F7|nr:uncharacterized protein LOC109538146 isoform X2 [Dendroctonus ponderosae]